MRPAERISFSVSRGPVRGVHSSPAGGSSHHSRAERRSLIRELTEEEAAGYRLAPDNALDWSDHPTAAHDEGILERWENQLDWLELDEPRPAAPSEEGGHAVIRLVISALFLGNAKNDIE